MKYKNIAVWIIFVLIIGCDKELGIETRPYPYLITKEVTNVNTTGATLNAELYYKGKDKVLDFGFIWYNENSEHEYSLYDNGGSVNNFTMRISSDLEKGSHYSCKAYIRTLSYIVFGNIVNFEGLGSRDPEIIDFNPKIGNDGAEVILTGRYFSHSPLNNSVHVNDKKAEILYSSDDTLIFKTPQTVYVGDAEVSVTVGSKKVIASNKFKILPGPKINSISSLAGHSGEYITIAGENFIQNGETVKVYFSVKRAEILKSTNTEILVVVPPYFDVLDEHFLKISVGDGLKRVEYNEPFLVKNSWEMKQPTPFETSYPPYTYGFTYNNKGYVFHNNILYEYDPSNNQWETTTTYPGESSYGGQFVVINDKLLRLGGYVPDSTFYDFWEYDFINKTWTKKTNIQFSLKDATHFILNNEVYIINGAGQVWKYNTTDELFTRLNDFPVTFDTFASSFIINNIAYVVTYGKTWQYDAANDYWIEKSTNPFIEKPDFVHAIGFSFKNTGYVLQDGELLYKYDPNLNRWIFTSIYPPPYPGFNTYKTTFVIGDKAYIAAIASNYSYGAPLFFSYQN